MNKLNRKSLIDRENELELARWGRGKGLGEKGRDSEAPTGSHRTVTGTRIAGTIVNDVVIIMSSARRALDESRDLSVNYINV